MYSTHVRGQDTVFKRCLYAPIGIQFLMSFVYKSFFLTVSYGSNDK